MRHNPQEVFKSSFKQFGNLTEAHWDQMMRHSSRLTTDSAGDTVVKPHYDQEINVPFQNPQVRMINLLDTHCIFR